ncbi:MAG: rhomboid family intramembrane serine protease [Nitriliruptor sp.]|nr:MAG: rhomboid family intramembrane serine protease [Nitriliruptor sp.]
MVYIAINLDARLFDVVSLPPSWEGVAAQPWTLLTVFFSTRVLVHIAGTVLIIGLFGSRIERFAGSAHLLGVYLLAGLAGSLALVATAEATGFDARSLGPSAAFLGLAGALAALPRRAGWDKFPLDKLVVVLLVAQLAPVVGIGDWVSSAAHAAGLAVGIGYGYLLRSRSVAELPDTSTSLP